jgi:hypothetical protein
LFSFVIASYIEFLNPSQAMSYGRMKNFEKGLGAEMEAMLDQALQW